MTGGAPHSVGNVVGAILATDGIVPLSNNMMICVKVDLSQANVSELVEIKTEQ